jgi:hypothetical protein
MASIDQFAYLWDGSEEGWTVRIEYRSSSQITVLFGGDSPTTREIAAVRKLSPELARLTVTEVIARVARRPRLVIGTYGTIETWRLQEAAAALGLRLELASKQTVSYLPMNEKTGMAVIISDAEVARRVGEEARARGIAILIECDDP